MDETYNPYNTRTLKLKHLADTKYYSYKGRHFIVDTYPPLDSSSQPRKHLYQLKVVTGVLKISYEKDYFDTIDPYLLDNVLKNGKEIPSEDSLIKIVCKDYLLFTTKITYGGN